MSISYFSECLNENIKIGSLLASNEKLAKSIPAVADFVITGLTMSPHKSSGIGNLCGSASDGCINSCVLKFAGRRVMPSVQKASQNRTALFFDNRQLFFNLLKTELSTESFKASHFGKKLLARLNVASDLPWEKLFPELFTMGLVYRFYDYTAIEKRALDSLSWNLSYDLTFSVKETTTAEKTKRILDAGGNVAIVVDAVYQPAQDRFGCLPRWVEIGGTEYPTVDGDIHDVRLREIDGCGSVVLLRNKGTTKTKQYAVHVGFAKQLDGIGHMWVDKPTTIDCGVQLQF